MAEGVLFNIAEEIIGRLGSLAFQEIGLLWGVKDDQLKKLQEAVAQIQAVLLDAEQKQANNEVKRWLKNLEDVVYDADDLLDEIYTEARQRQTLPGNNKISNQVCIFFSSSNQLAYRLKIGHKMKKINERLDVIATLRNNFNLVERFEETPFIIKERETHSFVPMENIIGRDEDKRAIIQLLMDPISKENENVSIIPIVGFGGLGKTALAQLVFNDQVVQKHFVLKMWICVSNEFELHILVKKIIESTTSEKVENLQMDQLQNKLRKIIDRKRYLLVLDDVWNEDSEKWLSLKVLLMGGAKGSRIIVTTRSEKVAMISNKNKSYTLRGLDEKHSWNLFKQMAFGDEKEPENSTIKAVAQKIARKCGGVPLVIRTIGRMLHSKTQETEWLAFENTKLSKIKQEENKILPALKISYDVLPSHLKHCFAYCSLFPPDYEFDVKRLIQLWVAQGFVKSSSQYECLEDVGYEYLQELLWRSFFQEEIKDEFGIISKCKMHDMMNKLAISVSGTESKIIYQKNEEIDFDQDKLRHVSFDYTIDLFDWKIPTPLLKAHKIRTFLMLRQLQYRYFVNTGALSRSLSNSIVSNFKVLRMLSLSALGIEVLPNCVGKLKHLRYLDLSSNPSLEKLPNWIVRLYNLQTLDLSNCDSLMELPRDFKKLINLRHLLIKGCNRLTHMPRGLGELACLGTLERFVVSRNKNSISGLSGGLGELNRLNELRGELGIENLRHGKDTMSESSAANMKEKQYLRSLSLIWKLINTDDENDEVSLIKQLEALQPHSNLKKLFVENYMGVRFANWLNSLTNIVKISLSHCDRCQSLPALDELPYLKVLHLRYLKHLEYVTDKERSTISDEFSASPTPFFPSIKELHLWGCPNLKGWWRLPQQQQHLPSLPSFTCLAELNIWDCPSLTSMPLYPYLDFELRLWNTSLKSFQETMMVVERSEDDDHTSRCSSFLNVLVPSFVCGRASSSSFSPLSKLKSLHLDRIDDKDIAQGIGNLTSLQSLELRNCPNLASLPEGIGNLSSLQLLSISKFPQLSSLPKEIGNLSSLQWLYISECPQLASLPEEIGKLSSLQNLLISDCPQLASLHEKIGNLSSLQRLYISDCPNLASLTKGLGNLTSLVELRIENLPSLVSLPEGIGNLKSLSELFISECPQLASLPEGMRHLTSLQGLKIANCSILLNTRCKKDTGEDWPKISHIPNFEIYRDEQDSETQNGAGLPEAHAQKIWSSFKTLIHCECATASQHQSG